MAEKLIPLPIAALELRWPWHRTYRAVLTGQLVSERRGVEPTAPEPAPAT